MTITGPWYAVMAIQTDIPWPTIETSVTFEGRSILLRPGSPERAADLVVSYAPPESLEDAVFVGNSFLSQLVWQTRKPARVVQYHGTTFPGGGVGTIHSQHISNRFRMDFKPVAISKKQKLALALYREAKGVKSVPYSALGYYKIIKLLFPRDKRGATQMSWINAQIPKIKDYLALSKLKELTAAGIDIGKFIYVDVRCAIAHANQDPAVNPDDPEDIGQIHSALPLLKEIARCAIEHEFGIKSNQTFRAEHKYELKGFRKLLDSKVVKDVLSGKRRQGSIPTLKIAIKMRDKPQSSAFSHLKVVDVEAHGKTGVKFILSSADLLVKAALVLDRDSERLLFDPLNGSRVSDNGSATAARYEMDRHSMIIDWLCNGETEVYSLDGDLLGTSDPYIPENIDLHHSVLSFRSALVGIQQIYSIRFRDQFGGM